MSRIRSIHPGLFTDEAFVSCSPAARLLIIGLWTESDDQGVFEWKPLQLKMRLFPADSLDVGELLAEVTASGMCLRFEAAGKPYGAMRNFCRFQRPRKPKYSHPAPDSVRAFVALSEADAAPVEDEAPPVQQKSELNGAKANGVPQKSEIVPQREDGGWNGKEEGSASNDADGQDGSETLLPEHVMDEWNRVAQRLAKPRIRELTPERRQLVRARIAQYSIDDFLDVFGKVERSPFLRGDTGGWRGCTFDWIMKKSNFQKTLEGNYDQ